MGAVIVSVNATVCGPLKGPYGGAGLNETPTGQPAETCRPTVYGVAWAFAMMKFPIEGAAPESTAVPPVAFAMSW